MRALILIAALGLAGCATTPPAIVTVPPPAELVRNPCEPGPDLMATPRKLPEARPGERLFRRAAEDRAAYRDLRGLMIALQEFVRSRCG
jgi:hypothetical protein